MCTIYEIHFWNSACLIGVYVYDTDSRYKYVVWYVVAQVIEALQYKPKGDGFIQAALWPWGRLRNEYLDNFKYRLSRNPGSLNLLEPPAPVLVCTWIAVINTQFQDKCTFGKTL